MAVSDTGMSPKNSGDTANYIEEGVGCELAMTNHQPERREMIAAHLAGGRSIPRLYIRSAIRRSNSSSAASHLSSVS